jgi:hypothetical protein
MPEVYDIRENGEYGTFFVEAGEGKTSDGRPRFFATWCCVSSYGVFGHYWSHMGEPFAAFIADIEQDYLLGKICTMVPSAEKGIEAVRSEILQNRRAENISRDVARDAWEAVQEVEDDGLSGEWALKSLFDSDAIQAAEVDWCDISSQDWPNDALQFARKLWPGFVKAVGERAAVAANH